MNHPFRIGITGGIGSGKSYVAHLVRELYGCSVYDSDSRARELMTSSVDIQRELIALLGPEAYLNDGSLNRTLVAEYLFRSDENASRINAIVHPVVRRDWLTFAQTAERPALLESAILIEAGLADTVDMLIVVAAPEAIRIQRAMLRDGATEAQVLARMARQMPQEILIAQADLVIFNDGRPLSPQIKEIDTYLRTTSI